jgi:hypothetical protein
MPIRSTNDWIVVMERPADHRFLQDSNAPLGAKGFGMTPCTMYL